MNIEKEAIVFGQTAKEIIEVTNEIRDLLIRKNESYGDSALSPKRIFSRADSIEQIKVRLDDKLNRLAHGNGDNFNEDVVLDLLGYLILLRIALKRLGQAKGVKDGGSFPMPPPPLKQVLVVDKLTNADLENPHRHYE